MAAVGLLLRSLLRRRWRSYLAIAVLVGVGSSAALAAGAGSRRTLSAYERYLRDAKVSDLSVDTGQYDPGVIAETAALPQVLDSATYVQINAGPLNPDGEFDRAIFVTQVGSIDGRYITQDRAAVIDGRLPDPNRADEVLINRYYARAYGTRVGEVLHWALAPRDDPETEEPGFAKGPIAKADLRVVGVGLLPAEVAQDDIDRFPAVLLTPAFTRAHLESVNWYWQGLRLRGGAADVPEVKRAIGDIARSHEAFVAFQDQATTTATVARSVRPLATALAVFAGLVALAVIVLAGQAFSRQLTFDRSDERSLRGLGLGPAARAAPSALLATATIALGVAIGVIGAVLLSPLFPAGEVRQLDPDRGVAFDATAVLGGAAVVLLVLVVITILASVRAVRRTEEVETRARPSRLAAGAGLGAAASVGLRFALEPGRGRTAVPIRTNLVAVVAAVTVVVAAVGFGASLDRLLARPALYGAPWSGLLAADGAYGAMPSEAIDLIERDPKVAGWAGLAFGALEVDGRDLPVLGFQRGSGGVEPSLLEGRVPRGDGELLLAGGSAETLHLGVGDHVAVGASGERPHSFTVVGIGVLPAMGPVFSQHTGPGAGALMTAEAFAPYVGGPGVNAVVVRLRPGLDAERELNRLAARLPVPESLGTYDVSVQQRPGDVTNARSVGTAPATLAAILAVAAVGSVALTVAVSARRRRGDLALLKAIGFTRRQISGAVAWQASVTMTIAVVIGAVLGVVAGRALWGLFAEQMHVVPDPAVPVLALGLGAVALVLAANLFALPVGRAAGRTPAAVTLRTE
ncbi:MAG: putative transport system permease protein [Actinomycetota bacterium]